MEDDVIVLDIDDDDDDEYGRNAWPFSRRRPRRRPSGRRPRPGGGGGRAIVVRGHQRAPIESKEGGLRTGVLIQTGAEVLAAIQGLPSAPNATGDAKVDMANLFEYQDKLAQTWKRNQQIRTIGSLARAFMQ